jgi:hypothetical protein
MKHSRCSWRFACYVALAVSCPGCNSRPTSLALQGEVSYEGQAVQRGSIEFIPVEQTPGASAVAPIADGRYALQPKWGLLPNGVYRVQITAFRKTGRKEPNRFERGGPPIEIEENFIPPAYNAQSTLKVRVADLPDKNKADFQLGRSSTAR